MVKIRVYLLNHLPWADCVLALVSQEIIMSAESMLFNGMILSSVLVLVVLAWGFLLLKIQGGEPE